MVDFAVFLENDDKVKAALGKFERGNPVLSWNHTYYEALVENPIVISIETKLTGRDWNTAQIQLGTWVLAHLNKLEELLDGDTEKLEKLPFLPLLFISGREWYFLAASRRGGKTVCSTL